MTSNLDLDLDLARLFIDEHGDDAEIHAAIQVDANRHEGDEEGLRVWLRMVESIKELRRIDALTTDELH